MFTLLPSKETPAHKFPSTLAPQVAQRANQAAVRLRFDEREFPSAAAWESIGDSIGAKL
jgi:hypothetical protein